MLRLPVNRFLYVGLVIALVGQFAGVAVWPQPAKAAGATIGFDPVSSTIGLGETGKVALTVSSDVYVNTVDVIVSYPTGTVLGVEANAETSVFTITLFPSTVDNTTGQARFRVSVPTPGAKGDSIPIGTLLFRGAALGKATLSVISAKVIANDGDGTNIYTGSSTGSITVDNTKKPQYTTTGETGPIPVVNSTSHPDPSKWYSNRNVTFTWGGGENDYNWVFDQNPDTLPPTSSKGGATTTTMNGVADGVWYFHVRAAKGGNWGPTSTFKVQIDGSAPGAFQLEMEPDPTKDPAALPLISFNSPDTPSGIDHYEIQLDDGAWVVTVSPYQVPLLKAGPHHVNVKAIDRAGNTTSAAADFVLKPLEPTPHIDSPKDGFSLALGDGEITGTALANSSVQLYADDAFITAATADKDGKFSIKLSNHLEPGKYTFKVKATMAKHLASEFSNEIKGEVVAGGGVSLGGWQVPVWVLMILYVVLILILLLVLAWLIRKWLKARQQQKLAMQKLELLSEADPAPSPQPTNVGAEKDAS